MKGKYLITTDNWFLAPDGKQYKACFGEVKIVEDSFLNIKTNRNSSNWFAMVGNEDNHVLIAGCQIHYAIKCENTPNTDKVIDYTTAGDGIKEFERPSQIYIA